MCAKKTCPNPACFFGEVEPADPYDYDDDDKWTDCPVCGGDWHDPANVGPLPKSETQP